MKRAKPVNLVLGASPRVNLLPDKQRAEKQHQETVPKLLVALVAAAAIAGLVSAAGAVSVTVSSQRLAALEDESTALIEELAEYAEVQQAVIDVEGLSATRQQITEHEVLVMGLQDAIAERLPDGVTIQGFSATLAAGTEAEVTDVANDLLCPEGTVRVSVEVMSSNLTSAASLVESVASIPGYECSTVTRIEQSNGTAVTTLVIGVGPEARSGRFQGANE